MTKEHPSWECDCEFPLSSGQHHASPALLELCVPELLSSKERIGIEKYIKI